MAEPTVAEPTVAEPTVAEVEELLLETLGAMASTSGFATALLYAARRHGVADELSEGALSALRGRGAVVLRDNFCADPHLDGVDLRVVALVADSEAEALARVDATWNRWLGEYLANHRCT